MKGCAQHSFPWASIQWCSSTSGTSPLCSRKEYKPTATVLEPGVSRGVLTGAPGLAVGQVPAVRCPSYLCNAVLHCPHGREHAIISWNDVILIAFVCCTAVQTLEIYIQPFDLAFFSLYTFTHFSALRHIDLIPSVS